MPKKHPKGKLARCLFVQLDCQAVKCVTHDFQVDNNCNIELAYSFLGNYFLMRLGMHPDPNELYGPEDPFGPATLSETLLAYLLPKDSPLS